MPPKKAKGQKMALSDFFADQATGSWADETDDFPTAPAPKDPNALRRGDPGYFESRPDRRGADDLSRGPPREELPIPNKPPYTAFVGNLTFETSEGDLTDFFSTLKTVSHKLISDFEGKPKGFGYVEFSTQDDLKAALDMTGGQLLGRTVRISVAEPPSSRSGGFGGPSMAEEASQWRRTGPLPTPAASASSRPGRSFDSPREEQGERDWSAARGSKFVPAPPSAGGFRDGPRREASGPGFQRESFQSENAGAADNASAWRSSKPLVTPVSEAAREAPPHQRGPQASSPGLADTEQTWTRASKLRVSEPGYSRSPRESTGESEGEWRGSRNGSAFNSRQGSVNGESGPNSAAASPQITRKALNLLPRNASSTSTPAASSEAGSASSATTPAPSKASPFGAAKPVDSAAREAEAAARLAKREEERKAAAAAKTKAAAEQKEKHQAQEREQPKRVHPSRAGSQQSEKPLSPPPVKKEIAKEKKEVAPKEKKEVNVRSAFSFAAAARAEGVVEDSNEAEEDEVKDVTKGVDEVAI